MTTIAGNEAQSMVSHWLQTPTNGYLGSGYGQDAKSMLQTPQHSGLPNEFLKKLRNDVPVIDALPQGSVNLYSSTRDNDKVDLFIEIAGVAVSIPGID